MIRFDYLVSYYYIKNLLNKLFEQGIITKKQYDKIDRYNAKYYSQ